MTSLREPGERNFNAVSHKPTRAPIQFNSICSGSFGLWDAALKFLSPGPRSDVTDHLVSIHSNTWLMKMVTETTDHELIIKNIKYKYVCS